MNIHPAQDASARQPLLVRCPNPEPRTPLVKDWTTINRDISHLRAQPRQAVDRIEEEDPERWDGLS
jgi:hypothetical protein